MNENSIRIDRLLWFLRFARSRSYAQKWIEEGHIRRNGERVGRHSQPVCVGDILTLPLARTALAIEVLSLPERRGPVAEAREHYRELDARAKPAIARVEPAEKREDTPQ